MVELNLSKKAKKVLEDDYFKALHKKMVLETKRNVLDNEIFGIVSQMDGLVEMLGYQPTMAAPESEAAA